MMVVGRRMPRRVGVALHFRVGAKLKIHKALSGDEVKCCQSIYQ